MQIDEVKLQLDGPFCDTVKVLTVNHTEKLSAASIHVRLFNVSIENGQAIEEESCGTAFVLATGKSRIETEIGLDSKIRTGSHDNNTYINNTNLLISIADEKTPVPGLQKAIEDQMIEVKEMYEGEDGPNPE